MGKRTGVEQIRNLFLLLIAILFVASFFFSPETVDWIGSVLVKYLVIPAVISFVVGSIVEASTGDTLKRISFDIRIRGYSFSVSAFLVVVLILRFFWF
jgi:hypothetical protein